MGHSDKEIKVVSKGYTIKVTSWEDTCDHSTGLLTVPTQALADELIRLLELFKDNGLVGNKNSHEHKTLGIKGTLMKLLSTRHKNVIDYTETLLQEQNHPFYIKQFKDLPGSERGLALLDSFIAYPLNLLGEEYAVYRACDGYTVTYSDRDVYTYVYKKEVWDRNY